ncbi:MAG: NAD(P)/FAD-dependent oxidoreductase [Pirellulaceae bacterium]
MNETWDVIVVGAGAAGLLAAATAAERGLRTLLLEKNRRPGVKILMSGGTRCNLTQSTDKWGIVRAYRQQGNFLHSALAALGPADLVKLVEDEGVPTKVEETGKIFPVSNRATDILEAFTKKLARSGAEMRLTTPVLGIERGEEGFVVKIDPASAVRGPASGVRQLPDGIEPAGEISPHREAHASRSPDAARPLVAAMQSARPLVAAMQARKVIVTVGGQSYPGSGTTGDGYAWAAALGHTIVPPRPALVPITTEAAWVRALSGITIPDVRLQLGHQDNPRKPLDERRGSLLFTHFGLSGPVVLDISGTLTAAAQPADLQLTCDFLPDVRPDQLDAQIRAACSRDGKKQVVGLPLFALPRRLVEELVGLAGLPAEIKAAELSKQNRAALVTILKASPIAVNGTRGFAKAEVTAGGVRLQEIDSKTLESKLVPGLYFAGEVLDLDGPIGGYNFQAAFSTGYLAGLSV